MISMLKEKAYAIKITNLNLMRERITSQMFCNRQHCRPIASSSLEFCIDLNFAKHMKLCIKIDGNRLENIIYQHYIE